MIQYLIVFIVILWPVPSMAIEEETVYSTQTITLDDIVGQMSNFTSTPEGGTDWELFSKTKEVPYSLMRNGEEWEGLKPEFPDALKQLAGTTIKMTGYMFPLEQTDGQSLFLFGPFPLSCPYHYHAPNSLTIEVHADKPINFSYDPVTIEGTLELVPEDYEYNTFYRINAARLGR